MSINFKELNQNIDPLILFNIINLQDKPKYTKNGEEIRVRCTIHKSDNQQSLVINTIKKTFFCHSECNRGGDLIELYGLSQNIPIYEAAKELAKHFMSENNHTLISKAKINPPTNTTQKNINSKDYNDDDVIRCWNDALSNGNDTYFINKKLLPPPITRFGKNPYGYHATMVALANIDGEFKGFISLSETGKFQYIIKDDAVIFSLLGEISNGKSIFIGEGIATVQTVWEAFDRNISAISVGSKSNFVKVANVIKEKYPTSILIILLDLYDEKAKEETQKIKDKFPETIIIRPNFENLSSNGEKRPKDFNDLISKCDQSMNLVKEQVNDGIKQSLSPLLIKPAEKNEIKPEIPSSNLFEKIKQRIQRYKENGNKVTPLGISTGYSKLDDVISGFQNGHLITVAARTGHGKSWVAINFLKNLAFNQKIPSLLISLEMSRAQIDDRIVSLLSSVSCRKIRDGNIDDKEIDKVEKACFSIIEAPLSIDENTDNSTLETLLERINKAHKDGIKFIVIDHIGLITTQKKAVENRVTEMAKISREIKKAAKSLQIPILVCAQLNREAEGAEGPKGSHIRESDTIKQDSDILIILHRPEKANKSDRPQEIDFIIDKNRDGEETTITFTYNSGSWLIAENKNENTPIAGFNSMNKKSQMISKTKPDPFTSMITGASHE